MFTSEGEPQYTYPLCHLVGPYTALYKNSEDLLRIGVNKELNAISGAKENPGLVLQHMAKGHWIWFVNPVNAIAKVLVMPEFHPLWGTIYENQEDKRLVLYQAAESELTREKQNWAKFYFGKGFPKGESVAWWYSDQNTKLEKIDRLQRFQQALVERISPERALPFTNI